ncbi:unnamed protein product, partial [Rotaria sordida]
MIKYLHKLRPLYWPSDVQLTLSIRHSSELKFLLRRSALSTIERLSITNKEIRAALSLCHHEPIPNIQSCEHYLRQIADDTRLRLLLLRYIILSNVTILICLLIMYLRELLRLVDLYDDSKVSQ